LKTLLGIESLKARPTLRFGDVALMPLVGCNAQQVRDGVCQRGARTRQGERPPGPMCPETLAKYIVKLNLRQLEVWFNGAMRALAQAGGFGKKVTGMVDATDLATPAPDEGCGQATRKRKVTDKHGTGQEIEVTVDGWQVSILIDALTKIPLALKSAPIQAHETRCLRALVAQTRTTLGGDTRRHTGVFDSGFGDGADLWWRDQHGLLLVVPAKANTAVTADARAQAAAGQEITRARRVHTVRHGQGPMASTERLETEVVGITGLTTYDQDGTAAHGRQPNRRDFQPHPINAVVVRQGHGRDYGPAANTVFLTNASVQPPLQPFDDDDARRLIEHCCLKASKQPWELGHPPQKTDRALRVHVLFTLLMFALATAYRLQGAQEATGSAPVGWQRWRRHLLEQTRDKVMVCAPGFSAIFHMAEYARVLGAKLKDRPPGVGTRQHVLAKFRLTAQG
jgi:hypothetical protein